MGSRINLVVIRDGQAVMRSFGGGRGYQMDRDLAPGPEIALRWLDGMPVSPHADWFPDGLSNGGAVIDVDERVLLWFNIFGACPIEETYAWRLAVLDAYSRTWPGWRVVWAYDGVADLVDYVGGHAEWVRNPQPPPTQLYPDGRPEESAPVDFLVTVARDKQTDAYELRAEAERPWELGPDLLDVLDPQDLTTHCRTVPLAGLHLDVTTRTAGLWSIKPLKGAAQRWPDRWPGWRLDLWDDDLARHLANTRDAVTVPPIDLRPYLVDLARGVDACWPDEAAMRHRAGNPTDLDKMITSGFGGFNHVLATNVTRDELLHVMAAITAPQPPPDPLPPR